METAQELADELQRHVLRKGLPFEAAAMLRQQAKQIEALKAERKTRKAYGDEQTEFAIKNANERDALKGIDRVEVVTKQMLDAAIDAMKGAT